MQRSLSLSEFSVGIPRTASALSVSGVVIASALLASSLVACSKKDPEPQTNYKPSEGAPVPEGPTELQTVDEVVGKGAEAKAGQEVSVHYTGTLMNGTKFDSSRDRNEPFKFKLGAGAVIKGWDQGVAGMKVGGKRKLTIPWKLAYGEAGSPPTIPAKAALKFDVELLDVK
jgi:FKBP-type peptidyl-prolyl cis-trans isomerase FkpA